MAHAAVQVIGLPPCVPLPPKPTVVVASLDSYLARPEAYFTSGISVLAQRVHGCCLLGHTVSSMGASSSARCPPGAPILSQ